MYTTATFKKMLRFFGLVCRVCYQSSSAMSFAVPSVISHHSSSRCSSSFGLRFVPDALPAWAPDGHCQPDKRAEAHRPLISFAHAPRSHLKKTVVSKCRFESLVCLSFLFKSCGLWTLSSDFAPSQNQQTRELISSRITQHKYNLSRLR